LPITIVSELLDAIKDLRPTPDSKVWIGNDVDPKADDADCLSAKVTTYPKTWCRNSLLTLAHRTRC
jgi:hypothetical protein